MQLEEESNEDKEWVTFPDLPGGAGRARTDDDRIMSAGNARGELHQTLKVQFNRTLANRCTPLLTNRCCTQVAQDWGEKGGKGRVGSRRV